MALVVGKINPLFSLGRATLPACLRSRKYPNQSKQKKAHQPRQHLSPPRRSKNHGNSTPPMRAAMVLARDDKYPELGLVSKYFGRGSITARRAASYPLSLLALLR